MNEIESRKKFVRLHAISQGIEMQEFENVLAKITHDNNAGIGDWCYELAKKGSEKYLHKDYEAALQYYNLARFPYINSIFKENAYRQCIKAFNQFCYEKKLLVKRLHIVFNGIEIPVYLQKSKYAKQSPLLLVIGGIVSIKEQWYQFLKLGKHLGFSVVLLDLPGVGENSSQYSLSSSLYISTVLDYIQDVVNVSDTHCIAMSFGGNAVIQTAVNDKRISSVITIGAPIYYFYKDQAIFNKIPNLTKNILKHVMNTNDRLLFGQLNQFSIPASLFKKINIPICYIFSSQDEIINEKDKAYIEKQAKLLSLYTFNDVHGSPNHMKQIKLIIIYHLLKYSKKHIIVRFIFSLQIKFEKLRAKFTLNEVLS